MLILMFPDHPQKKLLLIALVLFIGSGIAYYRIKSNQEKAAYLPLAVPTSNQFVQPTLTEPTIMVQIEGAVKSPGIYTVTENHRANDIIKKAGGPLPDADLEKVNLVAKVKDGKRIYVPHKKVKKEIEKKPKKTTKKVSKKPSKKTSSKSKKKPKSNVKNQQN